MLDKFMGEMVAVATMIVGLALIAVIVSRNAQTSQVIGAAGKALSDTITAAVKPVT